MNRSIIAAAAIAAMAPVGAQAASVLIDDFNGSQRVLDLSTGIAPMFSEVADPGVLGGFRDALADNDEDAVDATEVRIENGILSFSNIAGRSGLGTITYDGNDNSADVDTDGLGGFDLTFGGTGTGFIYEVILADAQLDFEVIAYDIFGGVSSFMTTLPETLVNTTFTGSFANFMGDADLTQLGALQFIAGGNPDVDNLDAQIDSISVAIIPLPAGVFLLGGALLGLGAAARRRKS